MNKELIKLLSAEIARTVDLDMMHHNAANRIEELEREVESLKASMYGHYELEAERDALLADNEKLKRERDTAWAQAHRLALELECLIMDTKDNAIVSKWWDSAFEAIEEYQALKPGADEDAEAWSRMRKAGI